MKYVDASAVLRVLFVEPGPSVPLLAGEHVVSSQLIEVEAFRAVDRERLLGNLSDAETAIKRKELTELLAMADLAPVDGTVIDRAKSSFAVNLRAIGVAREDEAARRGQRRRQERRLLLMAPQLLHRPHVVGGQLPHVAVRAGHLAELGPARLSPAAVDELHLAARQVHAGLQAAGGEQIAVDV